MKTGEAIADFVIGLVGSIVRLIGLTADGLAWVFDHIGEGCWRVAKWLEGL